MLLKLVAGDDDFGFVEAEFLVCNIVVSIEYILSQ